MIEMTWRNW